MKELSEQETRVLALAEAELEKMLQDAEGGCVQKKKKHVHLDDMVKLVHRIRSIKAGEVG